MGGFEFVVVSSHGNNIFAWIMEELQQSKCSTSMSMVKRCNAACNKCIFAEQSIQKHLEYNLTFPFSRTQN